MSSRWKSSIAATAAGASLALFGPSGQAEAESVKSEAQIEQIEDNPGQEAHPTTPIIASSTAETLRDVVETHNTLAPYVVGGVAVAAAGVYIYGRRRNEDIIAWRGLESANRNKASKVMGGVAMYALSIGLVTSALATERAVRTQAAGVIDQAAEGIGEYIEDDRDVYWVQQVGVEHNSNDSDIPHDVAETLASSDQLVALPFNVRYTKAQGEDGKEQTMMLMGLSENEAAEELFLKGVNGDGEVTSIDEDEIIVDKVGGFDTGEQLLINGQEYKIAEESADHSSLQRVTGFVDYDGLRRVTDPEAPYTQVAVVAESKDQITDTLAEQGIDPGLVEIMTTDEFRKNIEEFWSANGTPPLTQSAGYIIGFGGAGLVGMLSARRMGQRRELGVLKAQGATTGSFARMELLNGFYKTALATPPGLGLAIAGNKLANSTTVGLGSEIDPSIVMSGLAPALAVTGLSSFIVARRMARRDPVEDIKS